MRKSILFSILFFVTSFLILQLVEAKTLYAASPSPTPGCFCATVVKTKRCEAVSNNCETGQLPVCDASSCGSCTCVKIKPQPTADFTGVAKIDDFSTVFSNIVSVILGLAGISFFVLLIIGGFRFITSGGDPKAIEGARKTLTSAIIGLIVILMSYLVLVLIKTITGVDVTGFNIKLL